MDQNRTPDNTPEREPEGESPGSRRVRPSRLDRSGQDSRKRGWFWHWNEIITQYAPLIGLKGVGLLNSYTTWTDRRENSPHRGYAFPTQKAEAAFYGEDRAELITINKILTALDLIEIRKEMVTKPDAQGRQWKVPHNFYRVKDRQDGLILTAEDVLRVVRLAGRDAAVYRYVRRIFSPRFEPIDRHNVWHEILEEIAGDPTWRELCEKTARQESRASARTRAGHRTRSSQNDEDGNRDRDEPSAKSRDSAKLTSGQENEKVLRDSEHTEGARTAEQPSVEDANQGSDTTDAPANTGFQVDDDPGNQGSGRIGATYDDTTNTAPPSSVEPANTMYNQSSTTTTTTTSRAQSNPETSATPINPDDPQDNVLEQARRDAPQPDTQSRQTGTGDRPPSGGSSPDEAGRGADHPGSWGPLGDPSPLVVSLFEAANDRPATRLERILLSELERDAAPAAERTGATGAEWVAAALREAVSSGSAFVAPKRIQEIINRWTKEGRDEEPARNVTQLIDSPDPSGGALSSGIWKTVLSTLKRELDESAFERLLASSVCVDKSERALVVRAPDESAAAKLDREYRPLVERIVKRVAGRQIAVEFVAPESSGNTDAPDQIHPTPVTISQDDLIRGRQLWDVVLDDLAGSVPAPGRRRLAGTAVLGEDQQGRLLLGVDRRSAVELLQVSYGREVESALARFMQREAVEIVALGPDEWSVSDGSE